MLDLFGIHNRSRPVEDLSERLRFDRLVEDEWLFGEFEAHLTTSRPDLITALRFYREVEKDFANVNFITKALPYCYFSLFHM